MGNYMDGKSPIVHNLIFTEIQGEISLKLAAAFFPLSCQSRQSRDP